MKISIKPPNLEKITPNEVVFYENKEEDKANYDSKYFAYSFHYLSYLYDK